MPRLLRRSWGGGLFLMSEVPLYSTAGAHGSALRRALGRDILYMYRYILYMYRYRYLHHNVHVPYLHVHVGTRSECLRYACSCPGRGGQREQREQ